METRIVLFVVTSLFLVSCQFTPEMTAVPPEDKLAEIQARGTLVIATDANYVPQSQLLLDEVRKPGTKCEPMQYTANQFIGFDVEVAVEIANRLGLEPCFVTPPWSQLIAGNWGDNWDVHVGSVALTEERMDSLYFSQPYYATPTVVLLHEKNVSFQSMEDLSGKRIGVCAGCTFEAYLRGTLRLPGQELDYRIQNARIVAYQNEDPAIDDLSMGDGLKLDAVMTILPKARASIQAGKPLKLMDEVISFEYASVTLDRSGKRDPVRLLKQITMLIQELHRTGLLRDLSLRYQGVDLTQEAARFDLTSLHQLP